MQRADEIDSLNPKVAYYCRVYAIQQVTKRSFMEAVSLDSLKCSCSRMHIEILKGQ